MKVATSGFMNTSWWRRQSSGNLRVTFIDLLHKEWNYLRIYTKQVGGLGVVTKVMDGYGGLDG